ncbi:MAG TPA: histidine kinase dimerization/phospho-acceptor domain-containing protein [Candidatus Dormibacteraeota bacterium]|jgi:signal transduction histidine kinase|nr:histidine kinase dimerization/phospho-acceptor domain-containing protein [Candidatus Dormibacteraeota bacterium]
MGIREQTVLLISDDAALCARTRHELQSREAKLRVAMVSSVDAARLVVEDEAPSVILLEEAAVNAGGDHGTHLRLDAVVSSLAGYAPVVVLGNEARPAELDALVAAGAADYIGLPEASFPAAADLVERRLKQSRQVEQSVLAAKGESERPFNCHTMENFGQLLRHELNNPLTGILGNAELLLSEIRRKDDGRMPLGGQMRLETIAALAVRLRETVRRLSQEWETAQGNSSQPK